MKKITIFLILFLSIISFNLFAINQCQSQEDIVKFGNNIYITEGYSAKSVVAVGGHVKVNGKSNGDVIAIGGNVDLGPHALVNGSAVAIGGKVSQFPSTVVNKDIVEINIPFMHALFSPFALMGFTGLILIFKLMLILGFFTLVLVIMSLFQDKISTVAKIIQAEPAKSLSWGILSSILILPALLFLFLTIIGIFFIPVALLLICFIALFGYIATALYIGQKVVNSFNLKVSHFIYQTLIGLVLLYFICLIPFIGWLIKFVAICLGSGALIEYYFKNKNAKTTIQNSTNPTEPLTTTVTEAQTSSNNA